MRVSLTVSPLKSQLIIVVPNPEPEGPVSEIPWVGSRVAKSIEPPKGKARTKQEARIRTQNNILQFYFY